ncbi:MAG: ABC transporter substrate-binding protein, partial [bacterium]
MRPWITAVLAVVLFAAPLAAEAQGAGKVWQVGLLGGQSARWAPFRQGLRELGYIEGQNIATDWRPHHGRVERLPDLAAELARRKV